MAVASYGGHPTTGMQSAPQKVVKGITFQKKKSGGGGGSGGGAPTSSGNYSSSTPSSYGYSAPSAPSYSSYSSSSGGSSYKPSGGGGDGGGSGGGKPKPEPKPPKPKPPSIGKYLKSDDQYQRDRAALIKNFKNLRLTNKENRGDVRQDRSTTLDRLGTEQSKSLEEMEADFAARGLFGGAEYQNSLNEFNQDYQDQRFDTNESFRRNIEQLLRDLRNAGTLKQENISQARLEAIRRRAAEFGLM